MKDIQKIKEFFSKPLNETAFKKGDKVTYLGHPAEITKVNKEMTGAITYNVSYDKGNGKTKASNIYNKDGEIKLAEAITTAYEAKEEYFKPSIRKDKSNPNFLYVDIAYPTGSGVLSIGGSKTMGGQDRESGAAKALSMGNAIIKKLQSKYNIEDIEVKDLKNGKVQVFAVSDDFTKMASPSLNEAKSNPEVDSTFNTNKVWAFIESKPFYNKEYMPKFSTAEEIWSEFGPEDKEKYANFAWTDTYGDNIHPREKSALQRKANYDKLAGVKEIDVNDPVLMKARAAAFQRSQPKPELPKPVKTINPDYKTVKNADKIKALKLKRAQLMRDMEQEAEPEGGPIADRYGRELNKIDQAMAKISGQGDSETNVYMSKDEIDRRAAMMKEGKKETAVDMAKKQLDALGVKYELGNEFKPFKTIYKPTGKSDKFYDTFNDIVDLFNLGNAVKSSMSEAKEEDAVDTITMDIPLFIRMLEYSREDAAEDMDLHDVTEKAISLGKERGILQMDDYDEIIGDAEEIEENVAPNHNGKSSPYGSGYKPLEEKIAKALDQINEELCPAGKAYRKRRIAAGEKSSAYLSGRAVKVCKGQMSGKKKKK